MQTTERRTLANDWLKCLSLALKNVALYSAGHPRGRESVERAYESLRRLLEERSEVLLARTDGCLYLDRLILERDRGLAQQLQNELMARGIDDIVFHSRLIPEEHLSLIRCLLIPPDQLAEKGGMGQLLLDEGVSSVKVNSRRSSRGRDTREIALLGELALIDFLARLEEPAGGSPAEVSGMPSATSVLAQDPIALAGAILTRARNRGPGAASSPEILAETLAIALERLAERAIQEEQRSREEILADIGRAVVGSDPAIHPPLFLDTAGPGSIHGNVAEAVETLPPSALGDLVVIHYPRAGSDFRLLHDLLDRTSAWRNDRTTALAAVEQRLGGLGMGPEKYRDLMGHLQLDEVGTGKLLGLLYRDNYLWRVDFTRLRQVLVDLLASDQKKEASALIQKYLSGLMVEDVGVRRRVADNSRSIIQLLEKTGSGRPLLGGIAQILFTRFEDERDTEVVPRLAAGLVAVADSRLRAGELGAALDLMRQAERLSTSSSSTLRERGEKLVEDFSRIGDDESLGSLTEVALESGDEARQKALDILKRTGAGYLIERLASEQSRSHRARLVMLVKEITRGCPSVILPYLADRRWFLVRNLVAILGDIGEVSTLPHLEKVATHADSKVRREVVRSLMRLGTPACEDVIVRALADEDPTVQIAAVNALATLKSRRALGVLTEVSKRSRTYEEVTSEVRQEAILTLGRLGMEEVFPILADILSRKGFLGYTESREMRVAAAKALGGLHTPEAIALLEELADHDPRQLVREAAMEGLQQRSSPE